MAIDFPNSPTVGDTYITNGKQYRWDGTAWGVYGTFSPDSTASDTEPTGVGDGHIWYRSDQSQTLIRYDNTWVEVGSAGGFNSSSTSFPTSLDSGTGFAAVEALQAKVGVDSSAVTSSLDYRIAQLEARAGTNLLYNGAMQVAQRGASASGITGSGYHTADRWRTSMSSLGTWTDSIENDAPSGSGFYKSLKVLCTTAESSPSASAFRFINQRLEGQDLHLIKKGTSSAEQVTISFWTKSNVTGIYVVELEDVDNSRGVSMSYQILSADTWEKKTITFLADTTGSFDNDTAYSLGVNFWLGSGTTYNSGTLATSWGALTAANRAAGQTNLAAATNNYWQITGVQLEVGPQATPFEHLPYGVELARCQRYFERFASGTNDGCFAAGVAYTTTSPIFPFLWQTEKRANASVSFDGTWEVVDGGAVRTLTSPGSANVNKKSAQVSGTVSGMTAGQAVVLRAGTGTSYIDISAEL